MNTEEQPNPTELQATITLGIDAQAKWFYVARQVDGATSQPVQKMTLDGLLCFVARQQRLAREVYTCYEAGAFGYYLHRRLTALGVTNYLVQPQDWDERCKGVKNDRLDALALCQRLDRFTRGNQKAFSLNSLGGSTRSVRLIDETALLFYGPNRASGALQRKPRQTRGWQAASRETEDAQPEKKDVREKN